MVPQDLDDETKCESDVIRLLMLFAGVLTIFGICSQVLLPALRNRPLFPILNRKRARLHKKLEALRAAETDTRLRAETERLRVRVAELDITSEAEINDAYDKLIKDQELS